MYKTGDWKVCVALLLVFLAGMAVCQSFHSARKVMEWRDSVNTRLEASDTLMGQVAAQNGQIIELLRNQGLVKVVPAVPAAPKPDGEVN